MVVTEMLLRIPWTWRSVVPKSEGIRQFANDHEGITNASQYIAGLKPASIIIEATDRLEMPPEVSENLRL